MALTPMQSPSKNLPPLADFRSLLSFAGKSFSADNLAHLMNSSKKSDRMVPNDVNSSGSACNDDDDEFEDMVNWDTLV